MEALLIYLFKVNVAMALFYAFYRLLFNKDTFFHTRRFILLGMYLFAFLYPLINLVDWMISNEPIYEVVMPYVVQDFEVVATPVGNDIWYYLGIGYWLVVALFTVRLIIQFASICRLRSKGKKQQLHGMPVIVLNDNVSPFSFFSAIFINPGLHTDKELDEILTHESAHVRQGHSIDVVLSEMICIICWFNPFIWLVKREIRLNLEHLADHQVIKFGYGATDYQYHLLRLSHQNTQMLPVNHFNVSELKRRIIMMNINRSSEKSFLKYTLLIPIALFLIMSVNTQAVVNQLKSELNNSLTNSGAKDITELQSNEKNEVKKGKYEDQAYDTVEQMPDFPGGETELFKYLGKNIKYPVEAQKNGVQGRVIVKFVIDAEGNVIAPKIVRSVDAELDREAIRVVSAMPKWIPGKQNGKVVSVKYTLPIMFALDGGKAKNNEKKTQSEDQVFDTVEQMPDFPGGETELFQYLGKNIKYPVEAQKNGVQGRVIVKFVIDTEGNVIAPRVVRGVDAELDKEAIRVVSAMPKWIPGKQNGKVVSVKFTLPIMFSLNNGKEKKVAQLSNKQLISNSLVVIDGEKQPASFDMNSIDKDKIESMSILKGKSATQLYSDAGKNGVIVITTKK